MKKSHRVSEPHKNHASHEMDETQPDLASQNPDETHPDVASQEIRETHETVAIPRLRFLIESKYDLQKLRIMTGHRILKYGETVAMVEIKGVGQTSLFAQLQALEYGVDKEVKGELANHPVAYEYLRRVKGIGPILAAGLIAWIQDPGRFRTISKLWSYAGLGVITRCAECDKRAFTDSSLQRQWVEKMTDRLVEISKLRKKEKPLSKGKAQEKVLKQLCGCKTPRVILTAPKRKTGELAEWNTALKTHMWKIADSFIKSKSPYRRLYDERKKYEQTRAETQGFKLTKLQAHRRASRYMVKRFLAHLWIKWRQIEGLPVTQPYIQEKLGHTDIDTPEDYLE